ncbi:oligosaccharide flippase family protein [Flavobacteriaceae bacterium Ap0902]|nr:oligosaccharide flippase family protein [Flavobacteriaceae bacterium Ap0902]
MKWLNRFKNFSVYSIGQAVNLISPLLVTPYIIKISGEEGLGKVGICISICLILMGILDYSSYLQGTKLIAVNKSDSAYLQQLLSSVYSYKLLLLTVLLIPSILIPLLFFPSYKTIFILSLPLLMGHFLNPNWILYGLERYNHTAIYNIVSKSLYVGSVFLFVNLSDDYIWVNFLNGLATILIYGYAFVMLYKEFNIQFNRSTFAAGIEIVKADYRISLSEFCLSVYQFFPIVIVGAFTGAYNAGIYRVIEQIFGVLRTFIFLFFNFSYPTVCADIVSSFQSGFKLWVQYHLVNLLCIAFASFLIMYFWQEILLFFNVNTSDLTHVKSILYLSLLVPILIVISQAFRQLLLALGLMKWYSNVVYLYTAANVMLLLIFIPLWNLKGAFISMIFCEIFAISLYIFYINKYVKKSL